MTRSPSCVATVPVFHLLHNVNLIAVSQRLGAHTALPGGWKGQLDNLFLREKKENDRFIYHLSRLSIIGKHLCNTLLQHLVIDDGCILKKHGI